MINGSHRYHVVFCLLILNTEACRLRIMLLMEIPIGSLMWLIALTNLFVFIDDKMDSLKIAGCHGNATNLFLWYAMELMHACLSPPQGIAFAIAETNMSKSTPSIRHEYRHYKNEHVHIFLMVMPIHVSVHGNISLTHFGAIYLTRDFMDLSEQLEVIRAIGIRSIQLTSSLHYS